MSYLADLPARYRVILCDLWGCVHDGVHVFPGVIERLDSWREHGRLVVFLTNAPRPSSAVAAQLQRLGMPERLTRTIVSSGDAAIAWLKTEGAGRTLGFLGSAVDRDLMEAEGLVFDDSKANLVLCAGFDARGFNVDDYSAELAALRARGAEVLCLNPDRVVHRGGVAEPCAGALADAYAAIGGIVHWLGKPFPQIYDYALSVSASRTGRKVDRDEVIAIGDSIATDFAGAASAGIAFIFVSNGIDRAGYQAQAEALFDLAHRPGAKPVAVVEALA